MKNSLMFPILILNIFVLISCGGGGSQKTADEGVSEGCGAMTGAACEMFIKINDYRTDHGFSALAATDKCVGMAQGHAEDMVIRKFFSHESPTESFQQRAIRNGLRGGAIGENIAKGSENVDITFELWKNSPDHNANMLSAAYKKSGIGYFEEHWVQCFSSRD